MPQTGPAPWATVAEAIGRRGDFLLLTHENPDGDGIGSMLALRLFLLSRGSDAVCVLPHGVPRKYGFLPGAEQIRRVIPDRPFDCALALDCDGERRLGGALEAFLRAGRTVSIDHHQAECSFAGANWCDGTRAATGLMIHELLTALAAPLTPQIATCLYCAIAADTGVFRFQNTSPEALRVAAELVAAGADPSDIARRASDQMPLPKARLLGRALQSLIINESGTVLAVLTLDDFAAAGALPEHTDGIIDELKRIEQAQVTVLLREELPDHWRVSLRSLERDVAQVCRRFGGGGHRLAAGCELEGKAERAASQILSALESRGDQ